VERKIESAADADYSGTDKGREEAGLED
jgi:hypothetical protein